MAAKMGPFLAALRRMILAKESSRISGNVWRQCLVVLSAAAILFFSRRYKLVLRSSGGRRHRASILAEAGAGREPGHEAGRDASPAGAQRQSQRVPSRNLKRQVTRFGLQEDLFELGDEIGNGGQGVVHVCTRLSSGNRYAAKIINTFKLGRSTKRLNLLRREIHVMRELHHPRIVNLHEAFWEEGECIIVMDLAEKGDLFQKIESILDEDEVYLGLGGCELGSKHVARQLIDGLAYMQQHRVMHRDLKLENILITCSHHVQEPQACELVNVKIADFGLSKILQAAGEITRMMTAVGTPDYVAPEVLGEQYDERIDAWSLGVIIYVMLVGQMPFSIRGMNPVRHREDVSRVRSCEEWERVSLEGKSVVHGLLTIDPDERLSLDGCLQMNWLAEVEDSPVASEAPASPRRPSPKLSEYSVGVVKYISGHADIGLRRLEVGLRDGSVLRFGDESGFTHASCNLRSDELVVGVMQDSQLVGVGVGLGASFVFYTSAARVVAMQGTDARTRHRFVAPRGRQISGLQFEGTRLVGIHLERDSERQGSIAEIDGRCGSAVDGLRFKMRDGTAQMYGTSGGSKLGPWALQPEEMIVIVEQYFRDRGLGSSVAFYTSSGNVIKMAGMTAAKSRRFSVPRGRQLCGLEVDDHGLLVRARTCPANGDLQQAQVHDVS